MNKTILVKSLSVSGLFLVADYALASSFSTGMPWEAPMDKVVRSVTGPVARGAGIIALTAAGLSWALGAGGEMVQRAAKIGTGLSVAFSGTSYLLPMLGFAQGALL